MLDLVWLLTEASILIMGVMVFLVCFKSSRQNKSKSMLCLSIGFMFITIGSVSDAILLEIFKLPLLQVQTLGSIMVAIGFAYIIHSIYTTSR